MFMSSAPLWLNQKDFAPVKTFFSICFFFHQAQNRFATSPVSQIETKVKELWKIISAKPPFFPPEKQNNSDQTNES